MNADNLDITLTRGPDNSATVQITVRLFGTARRAAGMTHLEIAAPARCSELQLARLIQSSIPSLVGPVIDIDTLRLKTSHTFNLNGVAFIDGEVELRSGDEILLFSSQAGG